MRRLTIRPRQLLIWTLLLLLTGFVIVSELTDLGKPSVPVDSHGHAISPTRWLVPVPVAQLTGVEIIHNNETHRFERDAARLWRYRDYPTEDPIALAQRIEQGLEVFARTRIERQFKLNVNIKDYGVIDPAIKIVLYKNKTARPLIKYTVGDVAPDTVSRYVMIVGSFTISTIPNYQIEHLLALLALGGK